MKPVRVRIPTRAEWMKASDRHCDGAARYKATLLESIRRHVAILGDITFFRYSPADVRGYGSLRRLCSAKPNE